jgi:predicted amidophosphoribosyltransferase
MAEHVLSLHVSRKKSMTPDREICATCGWPVATDDDYCDACAVRKRDSDECPACLKLCWAEYGEHHREPLDVLLPLFCCECGAAMARAATACSDCREDITERLSKLEALRAAAEDFATNHHADCQRWLDHHAMLGVEPKCRCGFDALWAALRALEGS